MLWSEGKWRCRECGTVLAGILEMPVATLEAAPAKPTMHVLSVRGQEIHRCPASDTRETDASP
jgi:hypothetical protein